MKILVCGGRDLDSEKVCEWLSENFLTLFPDCDMIVHGGAKGADKGAALFCERNKFPVKVYKADWNKYGLAAGPIRNEFMLTDSKAEIILAFPGGKGTKHMINTGKRYNIIIYHPRIFKDVSFVECFED